MRERHDSARFPELTRIPSERVPSLGWAPKGPGRSRPGSGALSWGLLACLTLCAQLALGCGDGGGGAADAGDLGGFTGGDDGATGGAASNGATGSNGGAGASNGDSATSGGGSAGAPDPDEHPHQACVDRINELRATLSLPPLQRWVEAEGCSDQQANDDQSGGGAHGNFGACEEFGQNTCPGWPGLDAIIGGCLDAMWAEGPPPQEPCDGECFQAHGHFINMTSTGFTKVACGFHDDGQGGVWSNQNFK